MFELETASDMADEDNRADALHALDRCVFDYDYAAWARKYGRHLAKAESDAPDLMAELEKAEDDATAAEAKASILECAIDEAIGDLDGIDDEATRAEMREAIDKVVVALEKAATT